MYKQILIIFFSIPMICFSQERIGVLCNNFKIDKEENTQGEHFRKTFESVLSRLKNPPNILDREKIPELILLIEEEKNLYKDLGGSVLKERFEAAKIDYVVYGNFQKFFNSEGYELQIDFVKVSGKNIFSKKPLPIIRFTEKELIGTKTFEDKLSVVLNSYAFSEFGFVEEEQLQKIHKRLDEKDSQISKLENLLKDKTLEEDSIKKLKITPPDVNFELDIVNDSLVIYVTFNNNVPIEFNPFLNGLGLFECETSKFYNFFSIVHTNFYKIYPPKNGQNRQMFIYDIKKKNEILPKDKYLCIAMYIKYSSIYAAEMQLPELQVKSIRVDYYIEPYTMKFTKTKFID